MSKYEINYNDRSQNDLRGAYDTTIIMISSQVNSSWSGFGPQTLVGVTGNGKSNAGFTTILSNPLILDNNYEYVMTVSKISFDISKYTTAFIDFSLNSDQIAFQYYDGTMLQVIHRTIPVKCTLNTTTGQLSPFCDEPRNLVFRFLNPSNKVISRMTFQIVDHDGVPLNSTDPTTPTEIQLVIKKVTATQQY
jgi:hypothetical protein